MGKGEKMTRNEAIFELIKYRRRLEEDPTIIFARGSFDAEPFDMAVKALERKHGEWLETSESIGWEEVGCAECSVCGKTLVLGDYTMDDIKFNYNYCPNCGAKMEHD
jgi:DNA-directed RNA polymerase subunit RPC12/RpoP